MSQVCNLIWGAGPCEGRGAHRLRTLEGGALGTLAHITLEGGALGTLAHSTLEGGALGTLANSTLEGGTPGTLAHSTLEGGALGFAALAALLARMAITSLCQQACRLRAPAPRAPTPVYPFITAQRHQRWLGEE